MSGTVSLAVPPVTGSMLVNCYYDNTALEWIVLHDNAVLAWLVDQTGENPLPVILGTLPPKAPDTAPVWSPQWMVREGGPTGLWFIPDVGRGTAAEMFTLLATNNDAKRSLYGNFSDPSLIVMWQEWSRANPSLALSERPL
jgi:hypothetical protein